ncbi:hypothetical protein B0I35DRAFT_405433 [Stachybotrys elegans]|uniref:Cell surface protein n=1 Tax=Stachybotrys elegans TaxID=80388 RepID=A0A8K0WUZ9_9HYPO|nr:hypothetical protein B0I35DRAFT_405433 [Stachybotrys elegans]
MSSIVHKVKDAITPNKASAPEGSHGPHASRVGNAADPRIDSDRDGRAAHTTTTGAHDGTYTSGDNYTYGGNTSSGLTGSHTTGTGPVHNSNAANKLDPRTNTGTGTGLTGNTHTTGTSGLNNHSTTHGTAPVHNSNAANKLDPRVPTDTSTGLTGNTHTTGTSGLNSHSTTHGTGPVHNSNTMNKLDPRTGSSNTTGTTGLTSNAHTTGTSGLNSHSTAHGTTGYNASGPGPASRTAGPHSSNIANKVDPMTDSDLSNTRNSNVNTTTGTSGLAHGAHGTGFNNSGPGPAPNTAGPHKSDMLNSIDPKVDSDMDGSKTLGRDKTYSRQTNTDGMMHRDPTDAAQVPPSVLQKHVGPPNAAYNGHTRREGHHGFKFGTGDVQCRTSNT